MKLIILILLMQSFSAWAGNEGAHGGVGIISKDKLYVLDLFEAGLENKAFFDSKITPSSDLEERINDVFIDAPNFPSKLLASKIEELSRLNLPTAYALVRAMEIYNWRFVNAVLINTHDEDPSIVIDPKFRVQIALRKNLSISISIDAWEQLDDKNKVALILHEVIYGFYINFSSEKTSVKTREVVAYLMSRKMDSSNIFSLQGLSQVAGNDFSFGRIDAYKGTCNENGLHFSTTTNKSLKCSSKGSNKGTVISFNLWFQEQFFLRRPDWSSHYPYDQKPPYWEQIKFNFTDAEDILQDACTKMKKGYASVPNKNGFMVASIIIDSDMLAYHVVINSQNELELKTYDLYSSLYSEEKLYIKDKEIQCSPELILSKPSLEKLKKYHESLTSNNWK